MARQRRRIVSTAGTGYYQYLRRRNDAARRNAGINVLVAQTWDTLARLRLADGDIEGAERARVSARATSPRRR